MLHTQKLLAPARSIPIVFPYMSGQTFRSGCPSASCVILLSAILPAMQWWWAAPPGPLVVVLFMPFIFTMYFLALKASEKWKLSYSCNTAAYASNNPDYLFKECSTTHCHISLWDMLWKKFLRHLFQSCKREVRLLLTDHIFSSGHGHGQSSVGGNNVFVIDFSVSPNVTEFFVSICEVKGPTDDAFHTKKIVCEGEKKTEDERLEQKIFLDFPFFSLSLSSVVIIIRVVFFWASRNISLWIPMLYMYKITCCSYVERLHLTFGSNSVYCSLRDKRMGQTWGLSRRLEQKMSPFR